MHFGSMRLIQSSIVSIWWVLSGALDPDSSADDYEIKWACDEHKHVNVTKWFENFSNYVQFNFQCDDKLIWN